MCVRVNNRTSYLYKLKVPIKSSCEEENTKFGLHFAGTRLYCWCVETAGLQYAEWQNHNKN